MEASLGSRMLALFAARLGDTPAEGFCFFTHKPLTSENEWSVRPPGFSEEGPAQNFPTQQGSGHYS